MAVSLATTVLFLVLIQLTKAIGGKGLMQPELAAWMPNLPETIVVMLATSSIGAIFSSASPDFGVQGVLDRFGQIEPKVLVAVDGYYYNGKVVDCLDRLAAITEGLPSVKRVVVVPYEMCIRDSLRPDPAVAQG